MILSIVIVNYNVRNYIAQCIESALHALAGIDGEVLVVDNHSHDGSVEYLQKQFPQVQVMASNHNLGFSRANNIALRQAQGKYVLLLNPDTLVTSDTFRRCIEFMNEHPDCGALGVCQRNTDGTRAKESRRGFPTPMTSFYKMVGLASRFPTHPKFARYYMGNLPWDKPCEIDCLSGAFFFARREAIEKAGYMDEDYFMYGEDLDLSYCIKKAGYKNYFLPVDIVHYKGESTHRSSFRYVHVFYQAMIIFMSKHMGGISAIVRYPIMLAVYVKAFLALINIMTTQTREKLGFKISDTKGRQKYVFVATADHLKKCRQAAVNNALDAIYICTESSNIDIDHQAYAQGNTITNIVYDASVFSYDNIIDRFASKPVNGIHIGVMHPLRRVIVTPDDCFNF